MQKFHGDSQFFCCSAAQPLSYIATRHRATHVALPYVSKGVSSLDLGRAVGTAFFLTVPPTHLLFLELERLLLQLPENDHYEKAKDDGDSRNHPQAEAAGDPRRAG